MAKEEMVDKYVTLISELVANLTSGSEALYVKGEYFGFFLNKLIKGYALTTDSALPSFNSALFNEAKKKNIILLTDKIKVFVNTGDPMQAAAELHYVVNEVLDLFMKGLKEHNSVNPTFDLFVMGVIESVKTNLYNSNFDNPVSMALRATTLRRYTLALGVISKLATKQEI